MSEHPVLARLATELLAEAPVVERSPRLAERARVIARLAGAIEGDARRRRTARVITLSSIAVAAGFAMIIGNRARLPVFSTASATSVMSDGVALRAMRESGGAHILSGQSVRPLDDGPTPLAVGDRVVTDADGAATLNISTGTILRLSARSDLAVRDLSTNRRFWLAAGSVRADVANFAEGQSFVLKTSDAELEGRAASFRAWIGPPLPSCALKSETHVVVYEGTVTVRTDRGEAQVRAGAHWPACGGSSVPVEETARSFSAGR